MADGMTGKLAREPGQASAELLAVLPALVVCVVIAASALPAGWALWSAANAARAGARADHVGSDGERAARRALPGALRRSGRVKAAAGVRVRVEAPSLAGGEPLPLTVGSRLDPGGG